MHIVSFPLGPETSQIIELLRQHLNQELDRTDVQFDDMVAVVLLTGIRYHIIGLPEVKHAPETIYH